jgi:hypothetical protein
MTTNVEGMAGGPNGRGPDTGAERGCGEGVREETGPATPGPTTRYAYR